MKNRKNSKIDDTKVNNLIHSIGLKNNLSDHIVKDIVESQFKFTHETIKNNTNIEKDMIFYFKYIGKLFLKK